MSKYQVKVNEEKCIGCGSCTVIAPETFELEEGVSIVISQDGNSDKEKMESAQACPTDAIIVTDKESGEQVYP